MRMIYTDFFLYDTVKVNTNFSELCELHEFFHV
jgi:hypothetical protein